MLASEGWMLKVVAEGVGENEEVQSVYKKRVAGSLTKPFKYSK